MSPPSPEISGVGSEQGTMVYLTDFTTRVAVVVIVLFLNMYGCGRRRPFDLVLVRFLCIERNILALRAV